MMLTEVEGGPAVVVCNTCRHADDANAAEGGIRSGARLAEALRRVQQGDPDLAGVAVQEMACLFACKQSCTVHLRAPGKVGYVLGHFTPDEAAAQAILDYAVRYAASEHGQVPYKQWPAGVKGHFLCRTPPDGYVAT